LVVSDCRGRACCAGIHWNSIGPLKTLNKLYSLWGDRSVVTFNSTVDGTYTGTHGVPSTSECVLNSGDPEPLNGLPVNRRIVHNDVRVGKNALVVQVVSGFTVIVVP